MFRFGDPGGRMYGSVGTNNANLMAWWTTNPGSTGFWSVVPGAGRTTGSSLRLTYGNNAGTNYLTKTLDTQATWGIAFGIKVSILPAVSMVLAAFLDITTTQCDLRINPDGTLSITRNGTVLGTTGALLTLNNYLHLEYKVTIHPSAGVAQLWANGAPKLNLSGQNTRNTSSSSANVIAFGTVTPSLNGIPVYDFDDIVVYDGQTADANGFPDIVGPIGDCSLFWLLPTGAGTTTQFTPDTGANYARINEVTPDGDTSYVETSTVGNIDTYALADLPASSSVIKSVGVIHYARKNDTGTRGIKAELRSGGGNTAHATEQILSTDYNYYFYNFGQNPNNGSPISWVPVGVNALEVGQNLTT